MIKRIFLFASLLIICAAFADAQPSGNFQWNKNGSEYYTSEGGSIIKHVLPQLNSETIVSSKDLTPQGKESSLKIENFFFSADYKQILIYTGSKKVWRYNTRGDYWIYNTATKQLKQAGKKFPASSLMFAKFSPDGSRIAYLYEHNIYVENTGTGNIKQLTFDGTRKLINGTFDWAYEEEFFCRDGFRWSPDSKRIAYWQINAKNVKDYLMINNTDSLYPFAVPVEYPVAGEAPSPFKIGIVNISGGVTKWMNIPTDPVLQSYITRMEWAPNGNELIVQHLNRKQNVSDLLLCNAATGASKNIYHEQDAAWIDILALWDEDYSYGGWDWLKNGKEFLWTSEKDGWRHLYRISIDGKTEELVTNGNYDVMDINAVDETSGYVYFSASPDNATQKYLYRTKLDGSGTAERLTPLNQPGTHNYDVSPTGKYAIHKFSNYYVPPVKEWISLPEHTGLDGNNVNSALETARKNAGIQFFTVTTEEGITMDAWRVLPNNFDSSKKYPVVFFVYTEPWGQNVKDEYGSSFNFLYNGDMAEDGYIYVSIDNRGTPVPKGRDWRKCVYKKIGLLNIRDQALAAKEILKWKYADTSRVAVWGWSGGGSATLNLMFQYPEIYKTGIAIAAVSNELTYDNIYQERYMGLPQESKQDFINGSPITYAKNLKGNLLYIHGSGDDNVHYKNAELLINELVAQHKQFQLMIYPNRTHGIYEGAGTQEHLSELYTGYLRSHCPPGGR